MERFDTARIAVLRQALVQRVGLAVSAEPATRSDGTAEAAARLATVVASMPSTALLRHPQSCSILNHMVKSTQLDSAFGALADPIRRSVLGQLRNGESTVSELATEYSISLPAFLKHVRVLEDAGLVTTRKIGRVRYCRYSPQRLAAAEDWLRDHRQFWERQLDQLQRHFTDREREGTP